MADDNVSTVDADNPVDDEFSKVLARQVLTSSQAMSCSSVVVTASMDRLNFFADIDETLQGDTQTSCEFIVETAEGAGTDEELTWTEVAKAQWSGHAASTERPNRNPGVSFDGADVVGKKVRCRIVSVSGITTGIKTSTKTL